MYDSCESHLHIPEEVRDKLYVAFLDQSHSHDDTEVGLMFSLELAHWHYTDEYVPTPYTLDNGHTIHLPGMKFLRFVEIMHKYYDDVANKMTSPESLLIKFREYKNKIPTFGAIIMDKRLKECLMVQGVKATSWGFPKGKNNKNELGIDCAIREVMEETGIDVSDYVNVRDVITKCYRGTDVTLYIAAGMDLSNLKVVPSTKGEIGRIGWFAIDELPEVFEKANKVTNMFYMSIPFIRPLKEWIANIKMSHSLPYTPASARKKAAAAAAAMRVPASLEQHEGTQKQGNRSNKKAKVMTPNVQDNRANDPNRVPRLISQMRKNRGTSGEVTNIRLENVNIAVEAKNMPSSASSGEETQDENQAKNKNALVQVMSILKREVKVTPPSRPTIPGLIEVPGYSDIKSPFDSSLVSSSNPFIDWVNVWRSVDLVLNR